MSNALELIDFVLVTIVTEDRTVIAGRISGETLELQAYAGPSSHRANDILGAIGEALKHDEMFYDEDSFLEGVADCIPYESDGTLSLEEIGTDLDLRVAQLPELKAKLADLVRAGSVVAASSTTYYRPED